MAKVHVGASGSDVLRMRLLVVDDDGAVTAVLEAWLEDAGFREVRTTASPAVAVELCRAWQPDLLILDLHMPDASGFDVLIAIEEQLSDPVYLPVLVLTGDPSPKARHRALSLGARDFVTKPPDREEVLLRVNNLLHARDLQLRLQQRSVVLTEAVLRRTAELDQTRLEALRVLAAAAEYRDDETHQHTQRVGRSAALIARALALDDDTVSTMRDAAPLHDIGKIAVPDSILLKPGKLTDEERSTMQLHVHIGGRILGTGKSPLLGVAADLARSHHERWDGTGYLRGLSGDAIPLVGRITAVADVFDALTHDRPYKSAWPVDEAVDEITSQAGRQFDPSVVEAFCSLDLEALSL